MFGKAILERFGDLLFEQGFALYLPEEIRSAYEQGVFALDISDVDIAAQDFRFPERSLFEAVQKTACFRKKNKSILGLRPSRRDFLPALRSDFSDEQWKVIKEHFELPNNEAQLLSFPDYRGAEILTFCLGFKSAWRPFGKFLVLSGKSERRVAAKTPEDFGLNPNESYLGTIVMCKSFYNEEDLHVLAKEIGNNLERLAPPARIIEIGNILHLTH